MSRTHVRATSRIWIYILLKHVYSHVNITHEMLIPAHMRTSICTHTCTGTSKLKIHRQAPRALVQECTSKGQKYFHSKNTCTRCEDVHIFGTCTRAKHTNAHAITCNGHAHMQHTRTACHICIYIFFCFSFESHSRPVRAYSAELGTRSRGVLALRRGGHRRLWLEHAPGRCRQAGALMRNRASETGAGPAAAQAGSRRAGGDDAADGACQCPLGARGSGEHHAGFAADSTCAPGLASARRRTSPPTLLAPTRPRRKNRGRC